MMKSGIKLKTIQTELSSNKKTHSHKASVVVINNRKIDDFFSFSNTKRESSLLSSGIKTSTSNNEKPKEEVPTYLNKKREREQLKSEEKAPIIPNKLKKIKEKKNKKICSICLEGGDLLLCDKCPNSFHITCLKINKDDLPNGNWYCNDCLSAKGKHNNKKKKKTKEVRKNNNNVDKTYNQNDKTKEKDGFSSPSIMNSFFNNHKENINSNCNQTCKNELASSTVLNNNSNKYHSNAKKDKGVLPIKVLELFSKEERIDLINYFNKHKDMNVFNFEKDNNHTYEHNKINTMLDEIKESSYIKMGKADRKILLNNIIRYIGSNNNKNYIDILTTISYKSKSVHNDLFKKLFRSILNKKRINNNSKYPMDDRELYSNPTLYSLSLSCLNKPEGTPIEVIDSMDITSFLKIWDFVQSFSFLTSITPFPLEYLYIALKNSATDNIEIPLINDVYAFFIYILVKEVQETDLAFLQPESKMMMIKIICDNNNIKEFIKHSWPEIIKLFVQNDSETLLNKLPSSRDIVSYINQLSYENHVTLLNYLLNKAIETDFLRSIIKEGQEKRNVLKRNQRNYKDELKFKQTRKKELERQEKYTQPLNKIVTLQKKLETLNEDTPDLTRKNIALLRKNIEHQIEEFKSVIKESEIIKEEEIDILNQIERINNEISNIGVIDKKCIGTDAIGNKYYKFPWVNDKIYFKQKQSGKWYYLSSIEEVNALIDKLSEKGIKESSLKKKLLRIYPKHLMLNSNKIEEKTIEQIYKSALQWDNKKACSKIKVIQDDIEIHKDESDDEVIDINNQQPVVKASNVQIEYENRLYEEIIKKMNLIEEIMTEYLSFEGKQWESFDTRCNIKSWLGCIRNIDEYKKTITLWANRSKYPYLTNITYTLQHKRIDETKEYNEYYSLIDSNGSLAPFTLNQSLQLSQKCRFWLREYERLGLENIFNDYLSQVSTFTGLFFILYFFESLYNELTKQRDFLKKKSESIKANTIDFINSYAFNSTKIDIIGEENKKESNIKSRLRKHIQIKNKPKQYCPKNKRLDIDWDETCMFCDEFGDLICCEECRHVTHLYCAEMKKVPDAWLCEDCISKLKNKRITRSRGHYLNK